jgi:hypothetical protein
MKILSCLLIAAMMIAAAMIPSAAGGSYKRGDADRDGDVNISDATAIQRVLAQYTVSSFNTAAADVDGDGLDIMDATRIQRYLAQYDDPYHIGEIVTDPTSPTEKDYELPIVLN